MVGGGRGGLDTCPNVALEEPSLVLHAVIETVSAERNVVLVLRGEVVQEHLGQDTQRGESGDIE